MPEIMEANLFEFKFFKQPAEMLCDIIGAHERSSLIEANVIKVFPAVRPFE